MWIVELEACSTEEAASKMGALLSKSESRYQPAGPRNSTVGKIS